MAAGLLAVKLCARSVLGFPNCLLYEGIIFKMKKTDVHIKRSALFSCPARLETGQLVGPGRLTFLGRLGGRLASGH